MSLRTRLLVGMAFVAAVLVIVVGRRHDHDARRADRADRRATVSVRDTRARPGRAESGGPFGEPPGAASRRRARVRRSDAFEGYVDANGDLVTLFAPNVGADEYHPPAHRPSDDLPASGRARVHRRRRRRRQRTASSPSRVGDVTSITALPLDDVQRTISRLVLVEVVGSLAILAALGLVSWWVVHLGIRPVKRDDCDRHAHRRRRPLGARAGVGAGDRVG